MSLHACAVCGGPTLVAPGDLCPRCFWADAPDGPDSPNAPLTLDLARAHYAAHGHAMDAGDPFAPRPGPMRDRLLALLAAPRDDAAFLAWRDDWLDRGC